MSRIIACYNVFNEQTLIAESVRSVKAYVDGFVFVDAAYVVNPLDATHSTDATRQRALEAAYPLRVDYHESDRKLGLIEARNLATSMVSDGDWALIIDGDEMLYGHHPIISQLVDGVHAGTLESPIGMGVYTASVMFEGGAPSVSAEAYQTLPVIHSLGVQSRLVAVDGIHWQMVPGGDTGWAYHGDQILKAPATEGVFIVNHRIRQPYEIYQADWVWETNFRRPFTEAMQ